MGSGEIVAGFLCWRRLKRRYRIDYQKVALVLTGENTAIDQACLDYLGNFVKRKFAKQALIITDETGYEGGAKMRYAFPVTRIVVTRRDIEQLYRYYSYHKFFDNIVFTYTDRPKDNLLGRILRETDVNEDDATCLAMYHLRYVPDEHEDILTETGD